MQAIIFAAGESTRTYPLTLTRPKPLLPIVNKPILAYQLDALQGLVDEVVLVVGYRKEQIQSVFGDSYNGLSIRYIHQAEQLGTGHALLQCAGTINESFIAMNGDDLYDPTDLRRLADCEVGILAKTVPNPQLYGVCEVDGEGRLLRLIEKPQQPTSDLASTGVYKLTPKIFECLKKTQPSKRGEIEITCAIQQWAQTDTVRVIRMEGYWFPIAYPWHLLDANAYFLDLLLQSDIRGNVSPAAHLEGIVNIGQGTLIRPGAVIEGPVCIGPNCVIGPNCRIRPGTSIGNKCRVGQGVEIKNSILMDEAAVPHLSYVGDSIIGQNTNLGCGTVTSNVRHDGANHRSMVKGELIDTGRRKLGAIIGDNVHTGIHTSIYPGRKLWPNTTTRPGQIVQKDIME